MKIWTRTKPIRQIVIHVNVGPETPITSAEQLVKYLASITGGYHHVHDDDSSVRLVDDGRCVAGAKGGDCNDVAVHHCIIGRADQTAAQWDDAFSRAAIARCARDVAADCKTHGITVAHIVDAAIRDKGRSGICGHGDVSRAWSVVGGHTDPGPAFPWDRFIALVAAELHTTTPPATGWPSEWTNDMPKPEDFVAALETENGAWKLQASGGVHTVSGSFFGSYLGLPPEDRQGTRYFVDMTARRDKPGYVLWANDGTFYAFPV